MNAILIEVTSNRIKICATENIGEKKPVTITIKYSEKGFRWNGPVFVAWAHQMYYSNLDNITLDQFKGLG